MQTDALYKPLINLQLLFARLTGKQTGQLLKWHASSGLPAPAGVPELLPVLQRQIRAARLRVIVSTDPDCVMPSSWTWPVEIN
jgi:hypothetical protein